VSTLYIANTTPTNSNGVWRTTTGVYQYQYVTFTPGEDVNLDYISIRTRTSAPFVTPTNFQVGVYSAGINSSTPGSVISYLSGPATPVEDAYNDYSPSSTLRLSSGSQYWLGFTLSSELYNDTNTRVRLAANRGNYTTLGAGWSAPSLNYQASNIVGDTGLDTYPLVYSLYATPVCFASGTLIMMDNGHEKPIEEIYIGEVVRTSHGPLAVKWIAKRTVWKLRVSRLCYKEALPMRIQAGSLGDGIPRIDLLVSRCHGIWADGRVVNASFLENGITITQVTEEELPDCIQYYHLEFEEEVLVEANGAFACSYVNRSNRRFFDNYPQFISRYCSADLTVSHVIRSGPRNRPSLEGHKDRTRRAWMQSGVTSDSCALSQSASVQPVFPSLRGDTAACQHHSNS